MGDSVPTADTDRQLLLRCAVSVAAGLALIAVGLVLDPPLALLRRLNP